MLIWWQNCAKKVASGDDVAPPSQQRDTRGHPASVRSWTPKAVCGRIFSARVSDRQIALTGDGERKDIAHYPRALREIFSELSEDEKNECSTLCEEWNTTEPSEEHQRK